MSTETAAKPASRKWITPPEDYKLKSDVGAICAAAVERFSGKEFGAFYVEFCKDLGERFKKYGPSTMISAKQMAILTKLEVNNWPDGVQQTSSPPTSPTKVTYQPFDDSADPIPF